MGQKGLFCDQGDRVSKDNSSNITSKGTVWRDSLATQGLLYIFLRIIVLLSYLCPIAIIFRLQCLHHLVLML